MDGIFGTGGYWTDDGTGNTISRDDEDNVTNFSSGTLK